MTARSTALRGRETAEMLREIVERHDPAAFAASDATVGMHSPDRGTRQHGRVVDPAGSAPNVQILGGKYPVDGDARGE